MNSSLDLAEVVLEHLVEAKGVLAARFGVAGGREGDVGIAVLDGGGGAEVEMDVACGG